MAEQYVLCRLDATHQEEWEKFIEHHPRGHLLQSWSWGELKSGASWQPLRLALRVQKTGQIVAAAQVLQRTVAHLPARLVHLAYIPKGPVLDWTATTENGASLARLFLSKLRAYLQRQGASALHI